MKGKKALVWAVPLVTLAFGGAGAAVYRRFLRTAIEPETALLTPGMPITYVLVGLALAAAVILALLAFLARGDYPDSYGHSFYAPHPLPLAAVVAAGGLVVAAGILAFSGYITRADRQISRLVLGILLIPTGVLLEEIGRRNYRGEAQKSRLSALLLGPGYCACVWLVYSYQAHTANPVVLDYAFLLLGISLAILALYYQASFSFEGPRPGRAVWCSAMGVVLLLTAMGHREDAMTMCLCGGMGLYLLTQMTVLLYRGVHPADLPPLTLPETEEKAPAEEQEAQDRPGETDETR